MEDANLQDPWRQLQVKMETSALNSPRQAPYSEMPSVRVRKRADTRRLMESLSIEQLSPNVLPASLLCRTPSYLVSLITLPTLNKENSILIF